MIEALENWLFSPIFNFIPLFLKHPILLCNNIKQQQQQHQLNTSITDHSIVVENGNEMAFVWSTNLCKNSFEVIHTFIDYSERSSKYYRLEDRRLLVSVVCGNSSWKPPFIYRPNHLLQFGETSYWLLTVSKFLVPKKRRDVLFLCFRAKPQG